MVKLSSSLVKDLQSPEAIGFRVRPRGRLVRGGRPQGQHPIAQLSFTHLVSHYTFTHPHNQLSQLLLPFLPFFSPFHHFLLPHLSIYSSIHQPTHSTTYPSTSPPVIIHLLNPYHSRLHLATHPSTQPASQLLMYLSIPLSTHK